MHYKDFPSVLPVRKDGLIRTSDVQRPPFNKALDQHSSIDTCNRVWVAELGPFLTSESSCGLGQWRSSAASGRSSVSPQRRCWAPIDGHNSPVRSTDTTGSNIQKHGPVAWSSRLKCFQESYETVHSDTHSLCTVSPDRNIRVIFHYWTALMRTVSCRLKCTDYV